MFDIIFLTSSEANKLFLYSIPCENICSYNNITIIITIIIINTLFNVGHIHLQNYHFIAQANKNQPWSIIDIIITVVFAHDR